MTHHRVTVTGDLFAACTDSVGVSPSLTASALYFKFGLSSIQFVLLKFVVLDNDSKHGYKRCKGSRSCSSPMWPRKSHQENSWCLTKSHTVETTTVRSKLPSKFCGRIDRSGRLLSRFDRGRNRPRRPHFDRSPFFLMCIFIPGMGHWHNWFALPMELDTDPRVL